MKQAKISVLSKMLIPSRIFIFQQEMF